MEMDNDEVVIFEFFLDDGQHERTSAAVNAMLNTVVAAHNMLMVVDGKC